jgi:hypothetical protein
MKNRNLLLARSAVQLLINLLAEHAALVAIAPKSEKYL